MLAGRRIRVIIVTALCLGGALRPQALLAGQDSPGELSLFRIFLKDGSTVVSYGEFARVGDEVVLSMPLGADLKKPTLQLLTLPADSVDWPRTDEYSNSVRYQQYALSRGEEDFATLSNEIAGILNEIVLQTDPQRALELADQARRQLAAWPVAHFGYRAADVSDIIGLIDEAASKIGGGTGTRGVQLSFVAMPPPVAVVPVQGQLTVREQVRRLVSLADSHPRAGERIPLLRAALTLMDDPAYEGGGEAVDLRRAIEAQIRHETAVDQSYVRLATRLVGVAQRAAARAKVAEVERVLTSVTEEDARLGAKRPDAIRALRAELEAQLDGARDLRLRQDQWTLRRGVYRSYVDSISAHVAQLARSISHLEAIRQLAGPSPQRLKSLQQTLQGGANRLQAIVPPDGLRATHEVLIAAWRFAESAAATRQQAIISGDLPTAWQASSAAAGSLLFLTRAQREMRAALEPPKPK